MNLSSISCEDAKNKIGRQLRFSKMSADLWLPTQHRALASIQLLAAPCTW